MIDDIKAIEKTISELKTIQNRLGKALKDRDWAISNEIPRLESIIENLKEELQNAYAALDSKDSNIYDLLAQLEKKDAKIQSLLSLKQKMADELHKLGGDIIPMESFTEVVVDDEKSLFIKLPDGFVKFREDGKWGLTNKTGGGVECKYDEIGSFRTNLIGFRYNEAEIIKNAPAYFYRMPLYAKFKYSNDLGYAFDVAGVDCYIPSENVPKDRMYVVGEYYKVVVKKVINRFQEIELAEATEENTNQQISHVDNDDDFELGSVMKGVISTIKYGYRYEVSFPDGRETYFNSKTLSMGWRKERYKEGKTILLKKIGYDEFYKCTKWEIVT